MANPQMEINPLEAARIKRGISVAALADGAGISTDAMRQRLDRPEEATLAEITAIASRLDVDAIELLRPILAEVA